MDSPFWIYCIGLSAQIFYFGRIFVQWYLSEKNKRVESPALFWVFSTIGSMIMFLLSCLFLITSYRMGNVYIANLMHNMFSTKGKDDLYSDHTASDTRIIIALIINTCLMEGLLLFYGLSWYDPQLTLALQSSVFLHVFVLFLSAAFFITIQLFMYRLIGFTFTTDSLTELWVGGFLASQATLGLLLFPIVVITLVFPSTIKLMLSLALALYILFYFVPLRRRNCTPSLGTCRYSLCMQHIINKKH